MKTQTHTPDINNRKSSLVQTSRRYNWLPDAPDSRDIVFNEMLAQPGQLPGHIDLRLLCAPVANQGKIGSCTGNAIAGMIEFLELADLKSKTKAPEVFSSGDYENISRLFIYYNERVLGGTVDRDSGATLRNGMKTLSKWGVCREKVWSYIDDHVLAQPPASAFTEAEQHTISSYLKILNLDAGLRCLASGYPFVFGFTVFESFESQQVAQTGMVPLPHSSEQILGGHAVMAAGYDLKNQVLIVRNSWGEMWGDHGYFYLPFDYITKLKLAQDFWTVRK